VRRNIREREEKEDVDVGWRVEAVQTKFVAKKITNLTTVRVGWKKGYLNGLRQQSWKWQAEQDEEEEEEEEEEKKKRKKKKRREEEEEEEEKKRRREEEEIKNKGHPDILGSTIRLQSLRKEASAFPSATLSKQLRAAGQTKVQQENLPTNI
jgi:hypothetical protein